MAQPTAGPIVLPSDVELAVRDTMRSWVPHYLAEIDEQQDRARGTTEAPRTWSTASENDLWLEETPPALLVACPGTVDDPERHGDRAAYGAWWQINVGVTAAGATEAGSRDLVSRHAGAVVYVLAQQGDMGGLAKRTRWLGVRTDVIDRARKLAACEVLARVWIDRVVDTRGLLPRDLPDPVINPPAATPTPSGTRIVVDRT